MNKTMEERVKSRLLRFGKKNRFYSILVIPVLAVSMFFFHAVVYVKGNGKRFTMIAMTFFLFTVYSSFSFPIFIDSGENEGRGSLDIDITAEDISLAEETELDLSELELLEDEDVLEELGYGETAHGYCILDKYDAEEILQSLDAADDGQAERENVPAEEGTGAGTAFSRDDWRLVLINKQHSIPDDYTFTLGTIKGNMQCDERVIDDLLDMLQGAKEDGINLKICSPYRTDERQEMLFGRKITRYMNKGMSYMEAYKLSSQAVMVPGASEHQIGLSIDIVCDSYGELDEGFGDTDAGKWLAGNSYLYGFILRYPLGKEYITGVEYEPWHFRYVGQDAAGVITQEDITLEEFWEEYL